jgi:hypothetical protein
MIRFINTIARNVERIVLRIVVAASCMISDQAINNGSESDMVKEGHAG